MALENALQKLEDLEVGNVERIIRDIADKEYDSNKDNEKIEEKVNKDFAEYSDVIRKKLPKIIDNINLMADIILKLDKKGSSYHSYKINENDYFKLSHEKIEKKDKGIFAKKQEYIVPKIEIGYYEDSSQSQLELKIIFNEKKIINSIKFHKERSFLISEDNSIAFTESYLNLIKEGGYDDLGGIYLLPQVLNKIPYAIARNYARSLEKTINQKEKICSQLSDNKRIISALEVSDF